MNEIVFVSLYFHRYTMVIIYYAFALVLMVLIRPLVSYKCVSRKGTASIYAALYFFPLLICLQAVFGGLLCKYWLKYLMKLYICHIYQYFIISSKLADHSPGQTKDSFSIATTRGGGDGATPFPLAPLTIVSYLIILNVRQGGIKYPFLSL